LPAAISESVREGRQERLWPWAKVAVLFAAYMVYMGFFVNPAFLYWWPNSAFPSFFVDGDFLKPFATHPGGPVECVTALLMQCYYWRWAGSLVISLAAALLCLLLGAYVRLVTGRRPRLVQFIPALLLMLLYDRYVVMLSATIALVAATAAAWLYARLPQARTWRRAALFLGIGLAVYYAAGGAFLAYAALCATAELSRRRWSVGAFCVVSGAVVPFLVGMVALGLWPRDAYGRLLPNGPDCDLRGGAVAVLYWLSVPCIGVGAALWLAIVGALAPRGWRWRLVECVVLVMLLGAAALPLDLTVRTTLKTDYLTVHERWDDVIELAAKVPVRRYVMILNRAANRALYHKGLLADEMFAHPPQVPHAVLPSIEEMSDAVYSSAGGMMQLSDVMWDLGRVNEAEHMAQEVFSVAGPQPRVLLRLAMAEIAKRRPRAARPYLNVLRTDLIWGRRARELLERLEADPFLSDDPDIRRVRAVMLTEDTAGDLDAETLLLQLLERNRRNRMAFEYLMGHYLLQWQLRKFVANLHRLDDLGYDHIPRSYQEALLIYMRQTGHAPDLGGRSISEEVAAQFRGFLDVLRRHAGNRVAAWSEASRRYARTYFFYYWFIRDSPAAQ